MRKFRTKSLAFFTISLLLFSCSEDPIEAADPKGDNEGIRLKHFESIQAIGSEIESFLIPNFDLSSTSEIKDFGNYENGGFGSYEYTCSWQQITPLDPMGEYRESVNVKGVPQGWDMNNEREKTTKAELLENHDGYEEVMDTRLLEPPYKGHIIVLKNKDNIKGDWDFLAFIDPTHSIDGDGQRAGISGFFSPIRYGDEAKYDVPTDNMAISIFIKLLEPIE